MSCLELQPVLTVIDLDAGRFNGFTGANSDGMPDHGDEVALSTGFDP